MSFSRRDILGSAVATAASSIFKAPAYATSSVSEFLVLGDWGRDGASHQLDVANAMGQWAQKVGSQFVITVGDNFYSNGVRDEYDPQWLSSYERVYIAPSLQIPWFAALGNHDYRGKPDAQIRYAARSLRWNMPKRYYTVHGTDYGIPKLDLFVLDTSPLVDKHRAATAGALRENVCLEDDCLQLDWLDGELKKSQALWKLVVGHHPIRSGGRHGDTPEMIARVEPILRRHGVQAYLGGHDHDLQFIDHAGMSLIQSGGGSSVRSVRTVQGTQFCASTSGFARVRCNSENLEVQFIDYMGKAIYSTKIPNHQRAI